MRPIRCGRGVEPDDVVGALRYLVGARASPARCWSSIPGSASSASTATCNSWETNERRRTEADRACARPAQGPLGADPARFARGPGRHRLSRFRDRRAAAAAGHGRDLARRRGAARRRRPGRAPGITISCAPRSRRSRRPGATICRKRWPTRSSTASPPSAECRRCGCGRRSPTSIRTRTASASKSLPFPELGPKAERLAVR